MFKSKYDEELKDQSNFVKNVITWFVVFFLIMFSIIGFIYKTNNTGLVSYQECEEMYSTCIKINADIGTLLTIDNNDKMFNEFSKQSMISLKKQQLSRWVEEYNTKSRIINKFIWKSNTLPYQLNVNNFTNFNSMK